MVLALIIDGNLSLLRPHEVFPQNYFSICQSLAKCLLRTLCQHATDDPVIIVKPANSTQDNRFLVFSHNLTSVLSSIDDLERPDPFAPQEFENLLHWTLSEFLKYWGHSTPVKILVFTDGGATLFNSTLSVSGQAPTLQPEWLHVSLTFVSLSDDQISQDLLCAYRRVWPQPPHIVPLNCHKQPVGASLDDVLSESVTVIIRECGGLGTVQPDVIVRCGHMQSTTKLVPVLPVDTTDLSPAPSSFSLEIFGFLHISDLSNPPVASRHHLSSASDNDRNAFLPLLLTSMQETKTVAVCSIYATEQATDLRSKQDVTDRHVWRHGFLHQFDAKSSVLLLSVFDKTCTGLPWLGQFKHLAPVEDFAGVQLYDDREGSSPFPVLVPDRLSYGSISDSASVGRPQCLDSTFRYVSWVCSASLIADVNKLLRLGRRLPEKSTLFFKELTKVRSAALAYGCPDLLEQIASLTQAAHSMDTSQAVQTHLNTMRRLLAEPSADGNL
ncbi:hypothetical protein EG68_04022 [Paragonimus skrjabini miyazakii]|uniref:Integrator complex subunit 14 n=1 Tax=Paragonimus skrjabini miyazakii TaxID=59628 RepID=A0A8S9YZK6_9TREM|nr:hypothetical protein EG68_04022 [Paragonimus skrjabini miyazakii]